MARAEPARGMPRLRDMTKPSRWPLVASMLVVFGLGTSGCTGGLTSFRTPTSLGALSLVAFNSCDDALQGLRQAAEASVGPYGLPGNVPTAVALAKSGAAVPEAAPAAGFDAAGRSAADSASPDYSR